MNKKFLFACALGSVVAFSSCKKSEESTDPVSKTEAQDIIQRTADNVVEDLQDLVNSEGATAGVEFMNVVGNMDSDNAARVADKQSVLDAYKKQIDLIEDVFKVSATNGRIAEEELDLSTTKGEFAWNATTEEVDTVDMSIDKLILHFPADENDTKNSATFTLNEYTEDMYEQPTAIDMSLTVNDVEVASIDFTATFHGEEDPKQADFTLRIVPFTYEASISNLETSASVSQSLNHDELDIPVTSQSLSATWEAGADKYGEDVVPSSISADVSVHELKLSGSLDGNKANALEEQDSISVADVNAVYSAAFYKTSTNAKIGDISFIENTDGDVVPAITYSDGTVEELEAVLEDTAEKIEAELEAFFDEGGV